MRGAGHMEICEVLNRLGYRTPACKRNGNQKAEAVLLLGQRRHAFGWEGRARQPVRGYVATAHVRQLVQ